MPQPIEPGLNIRQIGEDAREGSAVLKAGTVVTPDIVGGLAAYGIADIAVYRRPTFSLVVTGSELVTESAAAHGPAIVDSNGPMIRAFATSLGLRMAGAEVVADDIEALTGALARADGDIVVSSGGASWGERDHVREVVESRGAQIVFHGLSMRLGKPVLFAILPDGRPFFGLPGNPVSACVGMRFFVPHAIRIMLGLPREQGRVACSDAEGRSDTTVFLRGCLKRSMAGVPDIDTGLDQRSHILSSLMAADRWLRVDRTDGQARLLVFPKHASLTNI